MKLRSLVVAGTAAAAFAAVPSSALAIGDTTTITAVPTSAIALAVTAPVSAMTLTNNTTSTSLGLPVTVTAVQPWTLTVNDQNDSTNKGFMVPVDNVGTCASSTPLSNSLKVASARGATDALVTGAPGGFVAATALSTVSALSPLSLASGTRTSVVDVTYTQKVNDGEVLAPLPTCKYALTVQYTAALN